MIKKRKGKNSTVVWNRKIYMDDKVLKKSVKYRRMIERGKVLPAWKFISFSDNIDNSIDIYSSREFWFKYQAETGIEIVGLASDYAGVLELLKKMVSDIISEKGEFNSETVSEYFR